MSGKSDHPFIKALLVAYCLLHLNVGKSPTKLEVTSRHDHSCLLGRKASNQSKLCQNFTLSVKLMFVSLQVLAVSVKSYTDNCP